jgi:hypothetical protein
MTSIAPIETLYCGQNMQRYGVQISYTEGTMSEPTTMPQAGAQPSGGYWLFRRIFFILCIVFFIFLTLFLLYENGRSIYANGI